MPTKKRTRPFKVGDRIQVVNTRHCFCDEFLNHKGTITSIQDEERAYVRFDNGETDNGNFSEMKHITGKAQRMNFIVIWDEEEDPCEFFPTLDQAKAKVMELIKDEDGNNPHNIRIVEIKSLWTVEPEVKLNKQY